MESIVLRIPLTKDMQAGAKLAIYGDNATGTIDYDAAISEVIEAWPRNCYQFRWKRQRWKMARWKQATQSQGWKRGLWKQHLWKRWQDTARWVGGSVYGPKGVGTHSASAKIFDSEGRAAATTPTATAIMVNTSPRPASGLTPTGLSGGAMVFSFTPSPDL